ncbi:hypothetical protein [Janibacter terrae]|uniref:hypothetical protein n=1 Tax=Janibacter terrae TaxID=103817 RepID=UPI00082F08CA|nr:hypothetical protein [Janibacter terrae]
MRPGNWPDRDVRHFDVVARFNGGPPVLVESMRLSHSMIDGHPSGHGGGMSTSGSITILRDAVASSLSPEPWGRQGDFPPRSGTPVTIDITDGEGQSWRRLTGITERATGSFSSRSVTIPVRDQVDKLGVVVSSGPMLDIHPPLADGGEYRRPRACAEWLLDRAARAAGWYATPQMRWEAIFSAPMVGSLWPERGSLQSSTNSAGDGGPTIAWTSQWQAIKDASAIWDTTGTTSIPELTMALHTQAAGTSMRVQVTSEAGYGAYVLTDSGGSIRFGTVDGGTITERGTLAKGAATRVGLRVTTTAGGTMGITVRTDTGAQATATPPSDPTYASLTFSRVRVYGTGILGWVQVLANPGTQWMLLDVPTSPTNAVQRVGETPERWDAAPQVWDSTAVDLLSSWARATCGQVWIDMDGRLQIAARGVLEAVGSVLTLSSRDALLDVDWEDDGMHVARQVRVLHQHPKIQRGRYAQWRVWQGRAQTLSAGEEDITTVEIPDDEDWISLDASPHRVTTTTNRLDILRNTVIGGMQISDTADSTNVPAAFLDTSMTVDGPRAWEVRVAPWATLDPSQSVVTMVPEELTSVPKRYRGLPLPDVKAKARVYRLERETIVDTVPGDYATVQMYEHDAGWWVQNGDRRTLLHTFLRYQMGEQQPCPTDVSVAPDLRVELGDVITIEDADRTGVRVVMLTTGIDEDFSVGSGLSMSLSGREIGWALPSALTPDDAGHTPAWTLEAS